MTALRIIYMGTPDFAVPSLELLIQNGYDIAAVVTAPDKPSGRGLKVQYSAVKESALKHSIPVLQPEKLKDEEFIRTLRLINANLFIVVAFRMLPEVVWQMPAIGTFNLHGSLLPKYRGAAPINWAIINGETETGCTTFFLQHQIDTGDILLQETLPIENDDTFGTVYDKLKTLGSSLVVKTVKLIETGSYNLQKQSGESTHAPKIFKEDGELHWNNSCTYLHNLVRGLNPFPGAWFTYNQKTYKVYQTALQPGHTGQDQGSVESDYKSYLKIACSDGWLFIREIQAEGKKKMSVEDFLKGNKL